MIEVTISAKSVVALAAELKAFADAMSSVLPGPAVRATVRIVNKVTGVATAAMATTITVDTVNEEVVVGFTDDRTPADAAAPPPGVVPSVSFDNPLLSAGPFVATPGPNTPYGDTFNAPLIVDPNTPVEGPTDVNATVTLVPQLPQGDPAPFVITVDPGAAVGARVSTTP